MTEDVVLLQSKIRREDERIRQYATKATPSMLFAVEERFFAKRTANSTSNSNRCFDDSQT
jgi:hypothetical protein